MREGISRDRHVTQLQNNEPTIVYTHGFDNKWKKEKKISSLESSFLFSYENGEKESYSLVAVISLHYQRIEGRLEREWLWRGKEEEPGPREHGGWADRPKGSESRRGDFQSYIPTGMAQCRVRSIGIEPPSSINTLLWWDPRALLKTMPGVRRAALKTNGIGHCKGPKRQNSTLDTTRYLLRGHWLSNWPSDLYHNLFFPLWMVNK